MSARDHLPGWLAERLDTAPRAPGCYLMRDRAGAIVYVGKAKDLKARLAQYFTPGTSDTRFFVGLLDRVLGAIDLIVTQNNKEALVLENELIKQHQPRFNFKLRDDKTFLSIRIGKEHPWPRVEVVRRKKPDGADYFGPYDSATAIRHTLRVINRHFGLRTCRDGEFRNRARPCLEYQIGRCPAPCVLEVDRALYEERLQDTRLFLSGRGDALVTRLREKMEASAERLDFELAAHYRDQIAAIERSLEKQTVRLPGDDDIDVVALYREGARGVVQVLELRRGVLRSSRSHALDRVELPDEDVLDDFLTARSQTGSPLPDLILTPLELPDAEVWSELLSEVRGRKVRVHHPQRGTMRRLLTMAEDNAREAFNAKARTEADALRTLEGLERRLGLTRPPVRIECYDISHIQGDETVGSMVVALDGALAKKEYRHFRLRGQVGPDDFESMHQVLSRRFKRREQGEADATARPDLLLIDGGKGQLAVAVAVLEDLGITGIDVASLAKSRVLDEDGHVSRQSRARPASDAADRSPERVFRPGRKNPVVLKPNTSELFLLQQLRDEAHRFAITHHRKRRQKRTLTSALDAVPGVGPARRRALLTHFGSLEAVRRATVEELSACPGISQAVAEAVREALGAA
ncbi:MAG: excinuclease ABC subunit UvrC [Deltaproteobacteria bacterium]|nr:excinuclease ABC subunit UvrC [Deltaproteobacteria bacterium]MCB9788353.1 excinuclease ABC subunit UvrC [Deltaproteobacteria bacterium]